MAVLQGNTSGSIAGIPYSVPCVIDSFILTNKTGGDITVSLSIVSNDTGSQVAIMPAAATITAAASYISNVPIKMLAGFTVYLIVSGSCDYYFSLSNIT